MTIWAGLITYNCGTVWSAAYSYDAFGNMMKAGSTSFMPTYNLSNQFKLIPSGHPSYDNNGNLLNDSFHTYAWDAEGHPVTIDMGSFVYDALGRRVEFGSGSSFTQYFYAAFDPHYNLGNAVAFSGGIRIPVPGGGQATANSGGVYGYRHPNWQGSQMVSSTTTRTVAADSSFSPYGERYSINGYSGFFAGMLMQYPFFTDGYQADARLFEDYAGRWVSPDPAGLGAVDVRNPQTLNRYVYVGDDPLNHVDPSGLTDDCSGPCTPFSYIDNFGCTVSISYAQDTNSYDIPNVVTTCPGKPAGLRIDDVTGTIGTRTWRARANCAADFGNKYSIASGIYAVTGISKNNPFIDTIFGNDASSISDIATGRNRLGATISEIFSNPGSKNVASFAARGVGAIPTGGAATASLGVNTSGSYFVKGWTRPTLAGTVVGKTAGAAVSAFTRYKAIYDFAAYGVGLASCW